LSSGTAIPRVPPILTTAGEQEFSALRKIDTFGLTGHFGYNKVSVTSSYDFEHAGRNAGGKLSAQLHDYIAEQAETLEVRRLTCLSGRLYHSAKMAETVVISTERL